MAAAFVLWQAAEILVPALGLPGWVLSAVVIGSLCGLPIALVLSWAYDVVPGAASDHPPGGGLIPRSKALAIGIATGVVTVGGLGIWLGVAGGDRGGATVPSGSATHVVVMPFEYRGGQDMLGLGEGMVDLLYMGLDGVGDIQVVEPRLSISAWREVSEPTDSDEVLSRNVRNATAARFAISGRIVQAGSNVRITADLWSESGERTATRPVDGSVDDVFSLVDALSVAVLRVLLPDEEAQEIDIASLASNSPQAIGAYLDGTRDFRAGLFLSATERFQSAVDYDSSFALAYLGLADTYGWSGLHGSSEQARAVDAAGRHLDRLPPRERRLARGYQLNNAGDPTVVDSMRAYVGIYPRDVRGWYALGDFQFHASADGALQETLLNPFEQALALDSAFLPALIHPLEITLTYGSRERFYDFLQLYGSLEGADRGYARIGTALWGEDEEAQPTIDSIFSSDPVIANLILPGALLSSPPRLDAILASMGRALSGQSESDSFNRRYVRGMFALSSGRLSVYEEEVSALESTEQWTYVALSLRLQGVLGGITSRSTLTAPLARLGGDGVPLRSIVEGMVGLSVGDTAAARRALSLIPDSLSEQLRLPLMAMDGWLRMEAGDPVGGLELLRIAVDSLPRSVFGVTPLNNVFKLEFARRLASSPGTRAEGIERLRKLPRVQAAPDIRIASLTSLATALEAEGDIDEAVAAHRTLVELLSGADPSLQPRVESSQEAISRLAGAGR